MPVSKLAAALTLPLALAACASGGDEIVDDGTAAEDTKADSSCPDPQMPGGAPCPDRRFEPNRRGGCITSYTCRPGAAELELFKCKTTTKISGSIHRFELTLQDPEYVTVDLIVPDPDNPEIKTSPASSPIGMLADQSDGSIGHKGRGLEIYSNSIDIQYTTLFLYASTDFKTGWVRVEDPGDYGHGNHFARVTCTRTRLP